MKYDLERLGPTGFQDLAAAIAIRTLGTHVQRMGPGRDGGRDMLATGAVSWGPAEVWNGTTIFQAKHKATLGTKQEQFAWLWQKIKKELEDWADSESDRGDVPNYLVFVTNVLLTPVPGSGGI